MQFCIISGKIYRNNSVCNKDETNRSIALTLVSPYWGGCSQKDWLPWIPDSEWHQVQRPKLWARLSSLKVYTTIRIEYTLSMKQICITTMVLFLTLVSDDSVTLIFSGNQLFWIQKLDICAIEQSKKSINPSIFQI